MSSNNSNNNSALQMPGFDPDRAQRAGRIAQASNQAFSQAFNELKDENAALRARLETTEASMARLSSVVASIPAQPVAGEATPVVPASKKQLRAKHGSAKKKVVRNYVHEKVDSLPDGFDFDIDYRVSPNKEVRKDVIEWVRLQPGSVDDAEYIDAILKMYFDTLRRKAKTTAAQNDADLQRKRQTTRVTQKLKARITARLTHANALEQEYPAGETVLVRECMSPELSDKEDGVEVMRVLSPGFRTLKVKKYIDTLDEYVKASKKRQNRSSSSNSNSTGDDDVVMGDAEEEGAGEEESVVGGVPIRTGNGRGNRSYKRFVRKYAVSDSVMSGQLASALPDWAL